MEVESETARLAALLGHRTDLEKAIAAAREELAGACTYVSQYSAVSGTDLRSLCSFSIGIENRIQNLTNSLGRLAMQITEQKRAVLKSRQDETSLAKLRARQWSEWNKLAERELEATSQELWLLSHTTNRENPKMLSNPEE